MEQTLASTDLSAKMHGRAHWALAVCMYGSGDDQRLAAVARGGVALCRQANDRDGEASALGIMGFATLMLGEFDRATQLLEEALQIFRELGDEWGSSHILTHLALVPLRRGDYPRAAGYAREALSLSRRTGDRFAANKHSAQRSGAGGLDVRRARAGGPLLPGGAGDRSRDARQDGCRVLHTGARSDGRGGGRGAAGR